jgi:hypothetical protein
MLGVVCSKQLRRLDHVRPEDEVDNRLRPGKQNENRPNQMPASDDDGKNEADFVRISNFFYAAFVVRLPVARCSRNSLGDSPKTRLNMRLNCVSD